MSTFDTPRSQGPKLTVNLHIDELPWQQDSAHYFTALRALPCPAWLDSAQPWANGGRYDILVADPVDETPRVPPASAPGTAWNAYLQALAELHRERYAGIAPASQRLPFCGGLLGYLGYQPGNALHGVAHHDAAQPTSPPAAIGCYDWCVVQDHLLQRSALVAMPWVSGRVREDLLARLAAAHAARGPFQLHGGFQPAMTREAYYSAFARIQAYIQAGDCYQVNLAQRFDASYDGDPFIAYRALREIAAAPFSGYLEPEAGQALLCLSPERFISLQGQQVETRPIKGTRPRFADPARDLQSATALRESPKDRAENLMIVDLLRNDLGRSCVPGSIHVEQLFGLESYPTVHHLVSTIRGELAPGRGPLDLLRDSFPGGSITGAPKRRAMQIIAELEPCSREAYCGSLLYISADRHMDSNIAIRSLVANHGSLRCWGGGGIVADSEAEQEYQETYDKVGRFLSALEQRFR
ncbi:MAG: aminodeoxychorismate synthase, component I [Haliea sp.]|uniref:aminodeoxychorismate synthase component I n=1 Tax=Haliea sp. TaxID=1932666 RepID=UPI000C3CEE6F|nr:aminodeoxychorismate synthase component I [Haliea sp.]MBM71093.1 aminodeoxychorismate synthase, component I [Haliea sp.]|tara:strand:+ start:26584 stop:27987 length:1404 start_codon:yes stop_codon:yes gene_type:complete